MFATAQTSRQDESSKSNPLVAAFDYSNVPPSVDINPADTDVFLAKEMTLLSMKDRDDAMNDVHGTHDSRDKIAPVLDTTATTIDSSTVLDNLFHVEREEQSLVDLETELDKIRCKPAYTQALLQKASYVQDVKLRLIMLRAVNHDAPRAAELFERHLAKKLELFGPRKLTKDITIDDINDDDQMVLKSGFIHLTCDMRGRSVIIVIPSFLPKGTAVESVLRVAWLTDMTAMYKNEQTQKEGIVKVVINNRGPKAVVNRNRSWRIMQLGRCLPSRLASFHYCYQDLALRPVLSMVALVAGSYARIRMRFHYGGLKETIGVLATYGIPEKVIPLSPAGDLDRVLHDDFLLRLKCQDNFQKDSNIPMTVSNHPHFVSDDEDHGPWEASPTTSNKFKVSKPITITTKTEAVVPGLNDVLLGKRGNDVWREQAGNVLYLQLLERHYESYERAQKYQKQDIVDKLIQEIWKSGGLFLDYDKSTGNWVELEDDTLLRKRVSHAFRNKRRTGQQKKH